MSVLGLLQSPLILFFVLHGYVQNRFKKKTSRFVCFFLSSSKVVGESNPFEHAYDKLNYIPANYTVLHTVTIDPTEAQKLELPVAPKASEVNRPRVLFIGSYSPRQMWFSQILRRSHEFTTQDHTVLSLLMKIQ